MPIGFALFHGWPIASENVQKGPSSKAAWLLAHGAYRGIREHAKRPTCLREAAPAKAGNAAGGLFQHSPYVKPIQN